MLANGRIRQSLTALVLKYNGFIQENTFDNVVSKLSGILSRLHSVDEDVIVMNASHIIIVKCNLVQ